MPLSWSFGADVPSSSRSDSRHGALAPGQAFGPYTVAEQIGEGATSRVYRAHDPQAGELALKVFKRSLDPACRERFRREGSVTAALEHPGIVRVLAGGEVDGEPFVAYELVPGATDLRTQLRRATLRERVRLLLAAASAVGHAHAAGIVHRDLKPANLLVDEAGQVRVADFGLALVEGLDRLTGDGEVVGTPSYMAPEQTQPGGAEASPATDVWALGVILYEALTGSRPFPASRWLELRDQIQRAQPRPPRELHPELPPALERVCLRALAADPGQRYPDARALAAELAEAFERADVPEGASAPVMAARRPGSGSTVFPLGRVGDFDMLEVLGQGGMGVVYRARQLSTGREVALKFVLDARGNARRLERFRREGEVTASLNHPAILRVHGVGVLEGIPYLEYELVPEARTLSEACRTLAPRERLALLRDAARGLGHAHARGVVHRDVKPDNVLVDPQGRVLVADFGLAAAQGMERLTRTGALVGTPHYMAPELVSGQRERVAPGTDVWALGVLLFELVTGQLPFAGDNLVQLSVAITSQPIPSPRTIDPSVDRGLEAICAKALARDPAERYPHADAFADDLEAWLSGRPVSASATAQRGPLALPTRSWALLALPLLIGSMALATAFAIWPSTPAPDPTPEPPPATPEPEAPPPPVRSSEGSNAWRQLKGLTDPEEQLTGACDWLAAFPGHGLTSEAEALVSKLRHRYPLRTLRHVDNGNVDLAFGDDGALYLASVDGTVTRWDPQTGRQVSRWDVSTSDPDPTSKVIAVDGPRVLLGTAFGLHRFDVEDQTALRWSAGFKVRSLALSPDRAELAVGRSDSTLLLLDPVSGETRSTLEGYDGGVSAIHYTPNGKYLIVFTGDKSDMGLPRDCQLCVWDLEQRAPVVRRRFRTLVNCIDVSPDGHRFVVGSLAGDLLLLDVEGGEEVEPTLASDPPEVADAPAFFQRLAHQGSCKGVVYSTDGATLYSISQGSRAYMNQLRVWDTETGEERRPVVFREHNLQSLARSPDGTLLAIGTELGTAEVWAVD